MFFFSFPTSSNFSSFPPFFFVSNFNFFLCAFRNSEKRKEKSRDAARCRRSRETEIFTDLANGLPLKQSVIAQLDKASVMRLVISYLKIQNLVSTSNLVSIFISVTNQLWKVVFHLRFVENGIQGCFDCKIYDPLFLKALEGFLVILSADGDLVYLSENVNEYLGISQVDMMGNSIYEFSHPCDHEEIREVLSIKSPTESIIPRSFFVRLKCTLTSKGRNVNLKSATYKVIHYVDDAASNAPQHFLIAIGEPIPHPSNIEIPLDKQTFLSKHSLDMKFTYADDKMVEFLGYNPEDLIGKSIFDFYHAMDSEAVDRGFKTLFSKGQCETGRYRFLAKGGGCVWVLTQATVIYDSKGQKPNSVVCVNFVIR
ncbi:Hypoxia-inducible factor 1 alpha, putative [Pediculus humanus corporis]|uniref:Hypoxia-inducible factor 1 alpha, putative n=1 Tax=Pediculus humanus subsp. corporis TaxID=121224 RepID=E0W068_PEDHC|nr:Hypoxia-inducible factor 1 alpha, putative [Pediculus humanus corporis]EEB19024.1 Hypoxia-inducible factor 1 alpha, putative [Pediculus humanus corporis]